MPEEHEGQNMYISECLYGLRGSSDIAECLRLALFLISNNFLVGDQDEITMEVFRMSRLNTLQKFGRLLSTPGTAAHAIALKFFASAIRIHDLRVVRMMLEAGMNPDTLVIYNNDPTPPLALAAQIENPAVVLEMTHLLLSYNAGSNRPEVLESALYHAIRLKNQHLVEILTSRGARMSADSLSVALLSQIPGLLQVLFNADWAVHTRTNTEHIGKGQKFRVFHSSCTILGIAVRSNNITLVTEALARGADVDALQGIKTLPWNSTYESVTTALGLAAIEGNNAIINILLSAHADVNHTPREEQYIPPLVLAVEYGHKSTIQRLFEAGADVSVADATERTTLIQRALQTGHLELIITLKDIGAKSDQEAIEDHLASDLFRNVTQNNIDTVATLLNLGANVNKIHYRVPDTVLGAAISEGHCEMIRILLQAGATNTGEMLIRIGNLETAKCLEQLGMLRDILLNSGQLILVSAIKSENRCLVEYLMDLCIDQQHGHIGRQLFNSIYRYVTTYREVRQVATSPLAAAIFRGNYLLAEALIERGAPITDVELWEAVERYGRHDDYDFIYLLLHKFSHCPCAVPNAFYNAMHYDHTTFLVQLFLDHGLDPRGAVVEDRCSFMIYLCHRGAVSQYEIRKKCLESVLEQVIKPGDISMLQTLLKATTWSTQAKWCALSMSIDYLNNHSVQDLLDVQADMDQNILLSQTSRTPLLVAIELQDISLIRGLLAAGADLEFIDDEEEGMLTPLQHAVDIGKKQIVELLLEEGADVNHPPAPCSGRSALQLATVQGNIELMEILMSAGADVNQKAAWDRGATALQFAAIKGYIGIARKLLDAGADINAARSRYYGRTALEGAAEHGRLDMLQLLLNEGASVEGPGRRQYIRAIKLAEERTHYAAAVLLRKAGGWFESDIHQYKQEIFDREEERFLLREECSEDEDAF